MKFHSLLRLFNILFICALVHISVLSGCKNKGKNKTFSSDSTIYTSQNFTDLTLDSQSVIAFIKTNPISNSLSNEVVEFYTNRNNQLGWFNQSGMTCAAPNFYNQLQSYTRDFADSSLNNIQLDTLMKQFETNERQFLGNPKKVQQLDLFLTTTFFKYAEKVYGGTSKKPLILNGSFLVKRKTIKRS